MKVSSMVKGVCVLGVALLVAAACDSSAWAGAEGSHSGPRQTNLMTAGSLKIVLPGGTNPGDWKLELIPPSGRAVTIEAHSMTTVIPNLAHGEYKISAMYKKQRRVFVFEVFDLRETKVVF